MKQTGTRGKGGCPPADPGRGQACPPLHPSVPSPPLLLGFQLALTIMRQTGGLGISIAGGKGSTPYKGDDEVRVGGILSGGGPGAAAGGRSQSPQASPPPPSPQGIFISRVSEEGPAAQAGVRVGDKLLEVGHQGSRQEAGVSVAPALA